MGRKDPGTASAVGKKSGKPTHIVGIGASAGGLAALEKFFASMSPESGLAFVVIQHLSPDFKSLMDDLLARHTRMAIHRVSNGITLKADSIYLIPPKSHMTVSKGKLFLTEREGVQHHDLPIDIFFSSLAKDAGDRAVAVILSGTGSDGSRGLREVHRAGGLVLVQTLESAQFDGMPRSALATGVCDLILPPEEMPEAILRYLHASVAERPEVLNSFFKDEINGEYRPIFSLLRGHYNLDFAKYKPPTVGRRIQRRMEFNQINDANAYAAMLAKDPEELDRLYCDLLIGVTEFFRDAKAFRKLEESVIPQMLSERAPEDEIRVWSAGCATGEEAYSLAILLHEQAEKAGFRGPITLFATDVHRSSLAIASQGVYETQRLKNVSRERLERYFRKEGEGSFKVSQDLRKMIVFAPHNLINDPPFTRIDLVCCRNLLIYLQPEVQDKALSLFHFALRTGGVLFLGASEGLAKFSGEFEAIDSSLKLFRKIRDLKLSVEMPTEPMAQRGVPPAGQTAHRLTVTLDRQLVHDYDMLLKKHVPAGVLINGDRRILHCFGDVSAILTHPEGRFENDLFAMVDERLKIPLGTALHRAVKNCSAVLMRKVLTGPEGDRQALDLCVECLPDDRGRNNHFFVSLVPAESPALPEPVVPAEAFDPPDEEIARQLHQRNVELELELQSTQENLQTSIEELQTSNEELQATNEEMLAANEELQSTNEELHSVNEELYTVNAEFELKNKELRQLNQDHENLLASTNVGIVYLDAKLRIRKFSPAIERFFNLLPQDVGRPIHHIAYHLDNQEQMLEDVRRVAEKGKPLEKEVFTGDGQWLLKRILPFRTETGATEGVVLTFTDITRLKSAEKAILELNQQLEQKVEERTRELLEAKQTADQSSAAKSLFLANMSHEIRTPMTGIIGTIQLLETTPLTSEQSDYVATLGTSAQNLLAILDDILDFSKIEAGRIELARGPVAIGEVVAEVVKLQRPRLEAKQLELDCRLEQGLPPILIGDAMRLKQVLSNLLANAIKFTEQGRIEIGVSPETTTEKDVMLRFMIRDSGIGLPPEVANSLFEPFTQADSSTTRRFGGTGLGLAICKRLVELMEGRIWFASNSPQPGASFHFTARFQWPPWSARAVPEPAKTVPDAAGTERSLRILVAEDDPLNRALIAQILAKFGHDPRVASNGREAVEYLKNEPVDLVLMDISMPEMDGLTATGEVRRLGEDHPNSKIPVIALTAHALKEDRERFLAAGMAEVLAKPFDTGELEQLLRRIESGGSSRGAGEGA